MTTQAKKNGGPRAKAAAAAVKQNGTGSLRERVRAMAVAQYESFEVASWGETVQLRPITVRRKLDLETTRDEGNIEAFAVGVLINTCFDPATGEPVWTADDADWILDQPAEAMEPLMVAALRKSGLADNSVAEGIEEGKGDS